jgi:hypothetical protein
MASTVSEHAAGASSIRRNRNLHLSLGFIPNNFYCFSRVKPQREYDVSIVYGGIDRPGDLTKNAM